MPGTPTHGGRAFFPTNTSAFDADIATALADWFSPETAFRDCQEIVGTRQRQARFVWANIGAFHDSPWTFTMTEAWAGAEGQSRRWTARKAIRAEGYTGCHCVVGCGKSGAAFANHPGD